MKIRIKEIVIFLGLSLLFGCVEQPKFDPCKDIPASTAEFTTTVDQSYIPPAAMIADIDTFLSYPYIIFQANDATAEKYEWKIGSDERTFTKKSFGLDFGLIKEGLIVVQLKITKRKQLYSCYANDDSVKISTKIVHIIDWEKNFFLGSWTGCMLSNPSDTFDILIKPKLPKDDILYSPVDIDIRGIPRNCENLKNQTVFEISMATPYNFQSNQGFGSQFCNWNYDSYGQINRTLDTFKLILHEENNPENINDKFVGTRKFNN